jgi:hypothetical protein
MHGVRAIEPGLAIDEILSEPLIVTIEGKADDARAKDLRRAALNLKHGWVVIKSAPGALGAATLAWRGQTRRTTDPAALVKEHKSLLEASIGAP